MDHHHTKVYYAKSPNTSGRQITVWEHLASVSEMAGQFGAAIGLEQEAAMAGLLHDFGKYSEAFEAVLKGTRSHVDHAICGAALLNWKARGRAAFHPVITAVNGHHDGLIDRNMLVEKLDRSVRSSERMEANAGKDAALCGQDAYDTAYEIFRQDFPAWAVRLQACPLPPLQDMLRTRMLYSCLVDADYTVSARDDAPGDAPPEEVPPLDAAALLETARVTWENERTAADFAFMAQKCGVELQPLPKDAPDEAEADAAQDGDDAQADTEEEA